MATPICYTRHLDHRCTRPTKELATATDETPHKQPTMKIYLQLASCATTRNPKTTCGHAQPSHSSPHGPQPTVIARSLQIAKQEISSHVVRSSKRLSCSLHHHTHDSRYPHACHLCTIAREPATLPPRTSLKSSSGHSEEFYIQRSRKGKKRKGEKTRKVGYQLHLHGQQRKKTKWVELCASTGLQHPNIKLVMQTKVLFIPCSHRFYNI